MYIYIYQLICSLFHGVRGVCGSAFLTFRDQKQSIMALNMRYTADDEEFVVSVPPDPSDVRWHDLQMDPRKVAASQTVGYGLIAAIFFGFIPIVAGITNLTTLESMSKARFAEIVCL